MTSLFHAATLTARMPGRCRLCRRKIVRGDQIDMWDQPGAGRTYTHKACTPPGVPRDVRCPRCLTPLIIPKRQYGKPARGALPCARCGRGDADA